jgi:hypothetical protein
MKFIRMFLVLAGFNVAIALTLAHLFPEYQPLLIEEDSLVENLSALFFVTAFFFGLIMAWKRPSHRKILTLIAGIGLLGFLDEISFGERLFALHMPAINGIKIDAAHDLFGLSVVTLKQMILSQSHWFVPALGLGSIILVPSMIKHRPNLQSLTERIQNSHHYKMGLIFVSLIALALFIDLDMFHNYTLFAIEELSEMNAALALIFWEMSASAPTPSAALVGSIS